MEYNLLGISALIVIILGLTWLKDGEKMDPPLKKRIVIDGVTIAIFWGVFEFYKFSNVKMYTHEIEFVILTFFLCTYASTHLSNQSIISRALCLSQVKRGYSGGQKNKRRNAKRKE